MTKERKKGQLRLEGDKPMAFIEMDDAPLEEWTPEQEAAARAVANAIKKYVETTETLAGDKYKHLRDKIPEHLANPGSVLTTICNDGVVVRYEKRGSEERKRVVAVMSQGIVQVAALLSQNLVRIQSHDVPAHEKEKFGVELKLSAHSPVNQESHDIATTRVWFQAEHIIPTAPPQLGAKPYCLLSVRNSLELEIHGVMVGDGAATEQPFITRTSLRLFAGWECIEVFPGLDLQSWNASFAPLWAEQDILGAVIVAQTKDAVLTNLDPRASARRQYASLLARFKALLDSNPEREQLLQSFLQENPMLLCPTYTRMWPKLPLGAAITDFVFRDASQEYILVELERSTLPLFRRDGHVTAEFTHAHGQIIDWKRYLEDNLATVQRELGLDGITPNPQGLLVIGRNQSLQPRDRRKLQTMASESPRLRVMTYDDIYENAKTVLENLLGPMWDTGGATEIYYPTM